MVFPPTSGLCRPSTMAAGLILDETPFEEGKELSHDVMDSTSAVVINFVYRLYGSECVVHRLLSFTVRMDRSTIGTCSSRAQRCRMAGLTVCFNLVILNSLSPCTSVMVKPRREYNSLTKL